MSREPRAETSATERSRTGIRILVAIYIVLSLAATGRSVYQIIRDFDRAPLAYVLSALAAVVYALCALALAKSSGSAAKPWRRVAWVAVGFELVGVLTVGVLSGTHPELFPADTVWSGFGRGYGFVPLVLPLCGIATLESALRRGASPMKSAVS